MCLVKYFVCKSKMRPLSNVISKYLHIVIFYKDIIVVFVFILRIYRAF
jgi:hypothetical protein